MIYWNQFIYSILDFSYMNTTIRKITCGLITATFGATTLGTVNGQRETAVASVVLGGAAMIASLITRQNVQRMTLSPEVAMELYNDNLD
jgi:hypothetical protein